MSAVTVSDGVVRRPVHPNSGFVAALLEFLDGRAGAPRHLGLDDARAYELVEFLPGVTMPPPALSAAQLRAMGRQLADLHDLTTGCPLAGEHEVVCHGDAGPHNTVFDGGRLVGLIDWEFAHPGSRSDDLADAGWALVEDLDHPAPAAGRLTAFAEGYGSLSASELLHLVADAVRRHDDPGEQWRRHARTLLRFLETVKAYV